MKDMSRNNGTKEMEMEVKEGRIRKTTYEKPSLMEYGPNRNTHPRQWLGA